MARKRTESTLNKLQPRAVWKAEAGKYGDGGGLWLIVKGDSASWVFRYTSLAGARRDMGLGVAQRGSLAQAGETLVKAREQARKARDLLAAGADPLDERERAKEAARLELIARDEEARQVAAQDEDRRRIQHWTLARCARDYHERVIEPSRTGKHSAQWISSLENHVPAGLWHAPIVEVTAPALLAALLAVKPHERARRHQGDRVPETLRRIRQRLEAVFEDAAFHGRATVNPAAALRRKLREAMPARQVRGGFKALAYGEAPALLQRLAEAEGTAARALEFAALTVARTAEVLGARWSEFDVDSGVWTVPAERTKTKEAHVVFLPLRAVRILRAQLGQDESLVFPSPVRGADGAARPLSNMAMLVTLGRLGVRDRTTVHGLCRATFSTWANETAAARPDVIEACLAHCESNKVRAAYMRAKFNDERRELLAKWAAFLAQPPAAVVPLPARVG
jgi:integrase